MFLIELNANGQRADYHTKGALHKEMPHSGFSYFFDTVAFANNKTQRLSMCVRKLCMCLFDSIIANLIRMYMHGWCVRETPIGRGREVFICYGCPLGWRLVLSIRQGSCRRSCIIIGWLNSLSWRLSVAMEKIANYRPGLHFSLPFLPSIINHFGFYCFSLNNKW